MKASIVAEEVRSSGGLVIIEIDEANFNKEVERVITKDNTLWGTGITTNWGYPDENISISASNVILSYSDYDLLVGMKADDSYTYLFCYKNETYRCVIQSASGVLVNRLEYVCSIVLSVIKKYTDMETS